MKPTVYYLLFIILFSTRLFGQDTFNLNFEQQDAKKSIGWSVFGDGNHSVTFDSLNPYQGQISGCIATQTKTSNFKALAYTIPATFSGKKIKLTGYLKTENVDGGFAGLWLRIDPNIAFDNMRSKKIQGTNDWTQYEIELDYEERASAIVFGGLLVGKGKIWIDDFNITIDGKTLDQAPIKELSKPQMDKEFDKGSYIVFPKLTTGVITNLTLLGRIWGFMKYHHPEIGAGNFNWDYELFRILPKYIGVNTTTERDALLVNWIQNYGEVPPCKSCKSPSETAVLKPDLAWIEQSNLSPKLKALLITIYNGRYQGDNYYVGTYAGIGNAEFKNEAPYADMPYPDAGFRLLCLYRYWNMVQYYFPYKHLMDKDWNSTLSEYIPRFINANTELDYEVATLEIIGDIQDSHANLWGGNDKIQEAKGSFYAPVHVKFIENQLVVDDYFEDERSKVSGLKIGDVITHINGMPVDQMVKMMSPYYPASNQPTRLRDISFDMLRSSQNSMDIEFIRDDRAYTLNLQLYNSKDIEGFYRWWEKRTEVSHKKLTEDIAYVTLQNITEEDVEVIIEQYQNMKGLIIDIRNYPSTFVVFSLGNFINPDRSHFVKFTRANPDNPGEFNFDDGLKVGIKRGWSFKGQKVVVMVNEISQSNAEYTTMALRASKKTTVIGSTTAGADGNVSRIDLPGGMRTMISGIGVYYPDGTETQRIGIVPDIEVTVTIEGIKAGRDEVLEKAIELIEADLNIPNK